ncbi:uncharacterized protein BHQ10_010176 [Talaromyces amestolkiae]|uniref:Uncharacterized protein n=1 Tax=Talaromyces amestolkiae TaxID=1196081 RepID=A0A364LEB4_TALAM|nr:uncharacterized protein BHQ10_010176 [Talaromyces amestolkiae]RAO74164.1 hypothetical protein BHQ10_010176 [Talaromyces amestolkiae]
MWAAQHTSPPPPRTSAKNLDLRTLSVKSDTSEEPITYPNPTDMWLGKHQRSLPSLSSEKYQYSVPSLSPRSSSTPGHEEDDDVSSQASGSTAFSATHPAEQTGRDRVHIHILSTERFEPSLIDGVEVGDEGDADLKSPFVNGLDDEPGPGIHDSLVSFHAAQDFNYIDRPRNAHGIPDSPPLTARPGAVNPENNSNQTPETQQNFPTGPLSTQLHTLLSQLTLLESSSPTVMASDYTALQHRLTLLQTENATLLSNRESLFSLRDEDVSNLIKIRTLLAQERRQHEALQKLRDDDLQNVIELRNKLAQATWANHSRAASSSVSSSTSSPSASSISYRRMEKAQSVSVSSNQNNDLWQTAKTAALEQRVLELESANADLRDRLDKSAKGQQQSGSEMQIVTTTSSSALASSGGFEQQQQQQPGMAALAELGLRAMRERESHKTEVNDLAAENLRLKQQVDKMKYQLETSQAVIDCFSQMLKSH